MEVKKNITKIEGGIIPEDWEERRLGELCDVIQDGTHQTPNYVSVGIPFYSVEHVTSNNFSETKFITEDEHNLLCKRCKPEKGNILLTRIGDIGSTKLIDWNVNASIYVSLALLKIKSNQNADYIYSYSKSKAWVNSLEDRALLHATPKKINLGEISKIIVPLPPLPEQKAIAEVLSDTDKLIQSLEKQIAKKRLIKQGAMQKLLSPKEGWESICIGYIGESYAGGTPSTFNSDYWGGNIIWLPSGRIQNKILTLTENEITITKKGLDESATRIIKPNSVLVAITGATCGNVAYITEEVAANQSVVAITPKEQYNSKFLYYSLLTARNKILSLQTGSAQGGTNLKSIKSIKLNFPIIQEQIEISNILSAIDSELFSLEKKLLKYKSLKQGLMQNLLTGKIRLV